MCERDCGEGSSVFHAVISEGRTCLRITKTSVTCSKCQVNKKASSWLCIRTLASYQEDEKCFIETTYASSHADIFHTRKPPTHPHAYPSQIHEICSWGVSDRGEYNDSIYCSLSGCDLLLHLQCVGPLMALGVIHLPLLSLFTVWALLVFLKDSVSPLWPEGDSLSVSVFTMFHLPSHFHLLNTSTHTTPA